MCYEFGKKKIESRVNTPSEIFGGGIKYGTCVAFYNIIHNKKVKVLFYDHQVAVCEETIE